MGKEQSRDMVTSLLAGGGLFLLGTYFSSLAQGAGTGDTGLRMYLSRQPNPQLHCLYNHQPDRTMGMLWFRS